MNASVWKRPRPVFFFFSGLQGMNHRTLLCARLLMDVLPVYRRLLCGPTFFQAAHAVVLSRLLQEWVCEACGGLFEPSLLPDGGSKLYAGQQPECLACGPSATVRQVSLPYALRYLVAELTCVGIKTQLGLSSATEIAGGGRAKVIAKESVAEQPT